MALDGSMEETETEILTYIGRRIQKGKIQHCFKEEAGGIVWYPKAKASTFQGAMIGSTYKIGPRFPQLWSDAKTGEEDEQTRLKWQALDRAAYASKSERSASNSPELDAAVDAIRMARSSIPRGQTAAFDAWLLNKIR